MLHVTNYYLKRFTPVFDENNPNWMKDLEMRKLWLKSMESYINDILAIDHLQTINDFLSILGFERREDGFDMVFHKGDSISVTLDDSTGVVHFVLNN